MNIYRFLVVFPAALLLTCVSFGQGNFFINVYFEGAKDYDAVYLFYNNTLQDSAIIMDKQARFLLPRKGDEWRSYFVNYKSKERRYGALLFHNAQSDISLTVDKEFWQWAISGDSNATEQNEYYKGLFALGKERRLLEKKLSESKDSVHTISLTKDIESFDKHFDDYSVNWVLQHNASPFSVAVIRVMIDHSNITRSLDTVAANCFDKLLPQAIKNNQEAVLVQRQFAFYSDKYSIVPTNGKALPFLIKDTIGNDVKPEQFKGKWLLIDFWASWCAPCRQSNPLLKEVFEKYHEIGLEVLSISVDKDSEKWKKAIKDDKMTWHQGSDLMGLNLGVGKSYQIIAVPTYFLISPEGIIVAKSVGDINKIVEGVKRFLDTDATGEMPVPQ
jgi:thiol-disulfide isomerase/thioredoxin